MNTRFFPISLAAVHLLIGFANAQSPRENPLGGILRGLGEALLNRQTGKVPPLRPQRGEYHAPRIYNVTDSDGNEGFIKQGQVFHVVGEGFGQSEGQLALLPEGSDQWITLRGRSIQSWRDDHVIAVVAEPIFADRQIRVAVGIVTAEGRSDAMNGIVFQNYGGGSIRPLPPIPGTRPGFGDGHPHRPHGEAPVNVTWSVAAMPGDPNESPNDTYIAQTLSSLGGPVAKGNAGTNTRHWAGSTIGLLTMGTPSSPPWHHFVVAISAGSPNAARLASTAATAGVRALGLRQTPAMTPPGGYPMLAVSGERLSREDQITDAVPEREASDSDARLMRAALRVTMPADAGRMEIGSIDELNRTTSGNARSVVKCISGEARYMTVLVFLSRTEEPYRRRDGRMSWRSARSLRIAVLGSGARTHDDCCRVFGGH